MRGKDLFEKITDIDDELIATKAKRNKKISIIKCLAPVAACACIAIVVFVVQINSQISISDHSYYEVVLEYDNYLYSVISDDSSDVYEDYNLERTVTEDMLGDYLDEATITVNYSGDIDTFKIYTYVDSPETAGDWYEVLILENSIGEYYYAIIGTVFD